MIEPMLHDGGLPLPSRPHHRHEAVSATVQGTIEQRDFARAPKKCKGCDVQW